MIYAVIHTIGFIALGALCFWLGARGPARAAHWIRMRRKADAAGGEFEWRPVE